MSKDLGAEIDRDSFRARLLRYTRRAYHMLPEMDMSHILDVGCGTGVSTLELARISDGEIIGIDIDQSRLDKLNHKIDEQGLSHRVKTVNCSLLEMDSPDERFDIIWAEGAFRIIGFEQSLTKCRQLLTPTGFVVIHDATKTLFTNHANIHRCGYQLTTYFVLPADAWWTEYYRPFKQRINTLHMKYHNNSQALQVLQQYQNEVDMVKRNPQEHNSAFYILQKSKSRMGNEDST